MLYALTAVVAYGLWTNPVDALNTSALAQTYFGNDAPWYEDRIPFFESSDDAITDVYYYRWKIFRSHQRDLGAQGYITTEFIDDVSWQQFPSAFLDDATQFHFNEGRWCRDRRFRTDMANFIYSASTIPDVRHFSDNMAISIYNAYLVDGVQADLTPLLDGMMTVYDAWNDHYNATAGLYYIEPLADATEYTISSIDASCGEDGFTGGEAYRPSINSYQYGNAMAIAKIASLAGNTDVADDYSSRATAIKNNVQELLWNSTYEHFIDRHQTTTDCVTYWDFIRGRELVGYLPWLHDLPDDSSTYGQAWTHLTDTDKLFGTYGLRTVEPSYEYYMVQYRYDAATGLDECQWNGPTWPYQTSQALAALGNVLDHYPDTVTAGEMSATTYMTILSNYANMHYNKKRGGYLNIEEDYNSTTGAPIVGLDRSSHYFHSSFVDLVISGLVGIRPSDDETLRINPLGSGLSYFRLENVIYHGNEVAVQWDADGSRYGVQGLQLEVNGAVVANSTKMEMLSATITRQAPPTPISPIAKSVQLQNFEVYPDAPAYPVGSVSEPDQDANKVQDAIDGRIWFFALPTDTYTISHGWQTPVGNGTPVWYEVDFGEDTAVESSLLAWYVGDDGVGLPTSYYIQTLVDGVWTNVTEGVYPALVENGITYASWSSASTTAIRLVFTPPTGLAARLVEWRVYSELVDGTVFA